VIRLSFTEPLDLTGSESGFVKAYSKGLCGLRIGRIDTSTDNSAVTRGVGTFLCICCIGALTGFRLMMSLTLHMWYAPSQVVDDRLLMSQALTEYYANDNSNTLAKNQGYGYWIRFFSKLGMNADVAQFCMWLVASIIVGFAIWRLFGNKIFALFAYVFVLWNPIAFDVWLGTRLYRNSLFPPLIFIVLGLMVLWLTFLTPLETRRITDLASPRHAGSSAIHQSLERRSAWSVLIYMAIGIALGLFSAELFLLKEDSLWLVPIFLFVILYKYFLLFRRHMEMGLRMILVIVSVLPIGVFASGVSINSSVNERHFGVALLNTRTQGELAGFVNRIYKIDDAHQTTTIWAPESSLAKAVSCSPTLQAHPDLVEALWHKGFTAPDIAQRPLKGDFLTWQIRIAIDQSVGWSDEHTVQKLFTNVNRDLDRAFAEGRLATTDKYFLFPSMGPRYPHEIQALIRPTLKVFSWNFYPRSVYKVSDGTNSPELTQENIRGLEKIHVDINDPNPQRFPFFSFGDAQGVATFVRRLYVVLNVVLLALFAGACLLSLIRVITRKKSHICYLVLGLMLVMYAMVYCFSIVWFTQFINNDHVTFFYATGSTIPLVTIGLFLAIGSLLKNLRTGAEERSLSDTRRPS
jgi:hypothetical protein